MKTPKRFKHVWVMVFLITGLVIMGSAPYASAVTVLSPGGGPVSITTDNTTFPGTGATLLASKTETFSNPYDAGTFTTSVYRVAGTLDFLYKITLTTGYTVSMTAGSFAGFTTSVASNSTFSGAGTVAPDYALRDSTGSVVTFYFFDPNVTKGDTSDWLYIVTDATKYGAGVASVQNLQTSNLIAYAPVPLPPTVLLLGSGLLGVALLGFRRRVAME